MTRFLTSFASAASRVRSGGPLWIRSRASGASCDLVAGPVRVTPQADRARLTHFRRAIQG